MLLLRFPFTLLAYSTPRRLHLKRLFVSITIFAAFSQSQPLIAGPYSNSAHGNSTYGVERTSTAALGYARGNCAHCHELHGTINGTEPAPVNNAPSPSALFYGNNVSQTDNVCLQCHGGSYQNGVLINRSYSWRAGGWTSDPVNSVKSSFSYPTTTGASHNLNDILTFIQTQLWGYKPTSNPCVACHNPHAAQGDPLNDTNGLKASGSRGYPISLPSLHTAGSGSWGLWGDSAGETLSTYTTYQAPYRYNSAVAFEPQGDTVAATAAQNTTDYVRFCTDCHNSVNNISSTRLGLLKKIDWANEKHGNRAATSLPKDDFRSDLTPPYTDGISYILSCLDCHEPHGSSNVYLLRPEVNGASGVTITTMDSSADGPGTHPNNKEWVYLCGKCHNRLGDGDGHAHPYFLPPQVDGDCSSAACHFTIGSYPYYSFACANCHYHGAKSPADATNHIF